MTQKTRSCYYMILFVYISLWSCQVITCHLTHSLIVLTDSYINLYKILDISLGILHLKTQHRVKNGLGDKKKRGLTKPTSDETIGSSHEDTSVIRLFDTVCTYGFKRLPVLGSFVNGLFLAALLMSAAIEGIQTCFHAHHSEGPDGQASILLEHPITYPGLLVGFALVGAMMQWCTVRAHEMREQELGSESLLNIQAGGGCDKLSPAGREVDELDVANLAAAADCRPLSTLDRHSISNSSEPPASQSTKDNRVSASLSKSGRKLSLNHSSGSAADHCCFETVPLDDTPVSLPQLQQNYDDQFSRISLKSLKYISDDTFQGQGGDDPAAIKSISRHLDDTEGQPMEKRQPISDRWWLVVRYCISPAALVSCALIIYFIHDEMVTEIADATFAILVVILLFTASYPPMKKAGKVLLQTAPDGVDLDKIKRSLKSISPLIEDIRELHVWSLTAGSNRVATCHLVMDKDKIQSDQQVYNLLRQARSKFLNQNIKCSTIQPIFVESTTTTTTTTTTNNLNNSCC